ncbi:MAG: selenium metabolism-associated LysR family transcriptional regulator [Candidatus Binatia bacterium]
MTLHQLKIFLAVARLRSFTLASDELHLSQPDVSLHIHELEKETGLSLFDRVGKRIHLTQAGEVLREHANRIFAQLRETEQALAELKGLMRGSLLIGASTTIGMYLLPQALTNFRRRFPGIKVFLKIANTQEVENLVRGMEVDVGFTGGVLNLSKEVKVETYLEDELVLILPPRHPLAKKRKVHLSDLDQETFVLRESGSATRQVFEQVLRDQKSEIKIGMELDSTEAIKWAVAEGLGVSVVSKHAVTRETKVGLLSMRRISGLPLRRPLHIVYHIRRQLPPAARAFLELLRTKRD